MLSSKLTQLIDGLGGRQIEVMTLRFWACKATKNFSCTQSSRIMKKASIISKQGKPELARRASAVRIAVLRAAMRQLHTQLSPALALPCLEMMEAFSLFLELCVQEKFFVALHCPKSESQSLLSGRPPRPSIQLRYF